MQMTQVMFCSFSRQEVCTLFAGGASIKFGKKCTVISIFLNPHTGICEAFTSNVFSFIPGKRIWNTYPIHCDLHVVKRRMCADILWNLNHMDCGHTQHQTFWQMLNRGLDRNRLDENICNVLGCIYFEWKFHINLMTKASAQIYVYYHGFISYSTHAYMFNFNSNLPFQ